MPDNLHAQLASSGLEHIGNALAVQLPVIEHVDFLEVQAFGPGRSGRALNIIGWKGPEIVYLARRPIDAWLALSKARLGQPRIGVGWRNLRQSCLISNRHTDLGSTAI